MQPASLSGLYAITPDQPDTARLLQQVESVLAAGVAVLQYRNKLAEPALQRQQAAALRQLTHRYAVPLIINDDLELALAVDADGVHLGADDGDLAAARHRLGPQRLLGASCYNQLALADSAVAAGASYVAFGAVFPSSTKPAAVRAPLSLLAEARARLAVPVCAIGGISTANVHELTAADLIAVIGALFDAPDIAAATYQLKAAWRASASSLTPA